MCGIFGYLGKKNIPFKECVDIIEHRGPDAEGFLQFYTRNNEKKRHANLPKEETNKILFGFRRLAIIDLEKRSDQPFDDHTGDYHIIFNGEIYNYKELRNELEKEGVSFNTESDTEVLLESYKRWGTKAFNKFNGMWAFAILDLRKRKVIVSRDRFGIKPFHYFYSDSFGYCFASEIKQLKKAGVPIEMNSNLLVDYIENGIIDASDETFFKDIFRLTPGTYMSINIDTLEVTNKEKYWKLEVNQEYSELNYEESCSKFETLFIDSVQLRFRSDVPVGSCLSGGLDSSSIVGTAATINKDRINTFTSRFDYEDIDETKYVRMIHSKYDNLQGYFCELTSKEFLDQVDKVLFHQDEPFSTMSILAQWKVMELSKEKEVIVLLDGQGGDESLAGYRKYFAFYLKELLRSGRVFRFLKEFLFLVKNKEFNFFDLKGLKRYLGVKSKSIQGIVNRELVRGKESNFGIFSASTVRERSLLDILKFSIPPLLRYEDRNSMAHSIETRLPFLDYRVVEFLYSISSSYKIRKGMTKSILRDSMSKVLPKEIKNRISKLGFETPQDYWMNGELKGYFDEYFQKIENKYINKNKIKDILNSTKRDNRLIFRIYCFDKWYKAQGFE